MIDAVIEKLGADIPTLTGRVQGALDFMSLISNGKVPTAITSAFVLPYGQRGLEVTAMTGAFVQGVESLISVVLVLHNRDTPRAAGVDPLQSLIDAVLQSLCGWSPDSPGQDILRLVRGALISVTGGLIFYKIDFAITDQLRIAR